MSRPLPPLNSLRAFEAAARHLSFKKAAGELHVTPAAVSHQIRTLEEYCGTPLFHRLARALGAARSTVTIEMDYTVEFGPMGTPLPPHSLARPAQLI